MDSLIPRDAVEFSAPPLYQAYWRTVEACSGLQGSFGEVRWFRTSGGAGSSSQSVGAWFPSSNSIVLNENFASTAEVVRHEILHAIERTLRHSARFLGSCGEIVTCVDGCVLEAGPAPVAPGPSAPRIAASSLELSYEVLPAQVGGDGYTVVIVRARNPLTQAVFVPLESTNGVEFVCRVQGNPCDGISVLGPGSQSAFGASQRRQEAFMLSTGPGTHRVVVGFDTFLRDTFDIVVP